MKGQLPEAWTMADLLQPLDPDVFLEQHWERAPIHVTGRGNVFKELLRTAELEHVIRWHPLRDGDLRVAGPDAKEWQSKLFDHRTGLLDQTCLRRARASGATVILEMVQCRLPRVGSLCRSLEDLFRQPVTANVVLTPRCSRGFELHFDYQDIFILQIDGTKRWRIYEPLVELPLAEQFRFPLAQDKLGSPRMEVELQPGDLLFVPRGFPHEATAEASDSLQIGVGVHVCRIADLLLNALDDLAERDLSLRRALPPGALAPESETRLSALFDVEIQKLPELLNASAAYERWLTTQVRWVRRAAGGVP